MLSPGAPGHGRQGRKLAGVPNQFGQPVSLLGTSAFSYFSFISEGVCKTTAPHRGVNYTLSSGCLFVCSKGECSTWPADTVLQVAELRMSLYFEILF